ncbi:MAG: aminopeptidase P family protein [Acidobacteria bacterium]|nr:aminopeptidase P family protein [Acidobacteriota bacterium]
MKRSDYFRAVRFLAVLLGCMAAAGQAWAQEREPLEVYRERRAALREKLKDGIIVLFGNQEDTGSEAYQVFRQENNFYYLTGLNEPDAALLLAPPLQDRRSPYWKQFSELPREILFLPPPNPQQEKWTGPKPDLYDDSIHARVGFAAVQGVATLENEIRRLAPGYRTVYTLLPSAHASQMETALYKGRLEKLQAILPFARIQDARRALASLRQIKSESELGLIRRAVDCSIDAHLVAARELRAGLFEYEIAALMKYTFERAGCERPSFAPIVGSGERSTILHYNRNRGQLEAGDLVLIDVGGEYGHYAADITRTLPVSGRFTPRQREIYEIVLGAQQAAIEAVKPGVNLTGRDSGSLYQIAYQHINTHGKDRHGKPLGKYFTHGVGHHVGLDVHDAAVPRTTLEAGMVIAIEPGIYLPEENLGVRIEDMVLVTSDGYLLLTEQLPRTAKQIESLMQK